MAAEGKKISTLVIKVDLSCKKCYNKIRKILCKYHCLILSKTFDDKNNRVIITGYFHPCFSQKLCCEAGKVIISIEELKPPPQKPPATPIPVRPPPTESVPVQPPPTESVPVQPPPPEKVEKPPQKKPEPEPEPEPEPKRKPYPDTGVPYFIPCYPLPPPDFPPFGVCCGPCYQGISGGPCHHQPLPAPYYQDCDYGKPVAPPPCSCGCGGYRRCSSNPCEYFTDENPNSCNVM